MLDCWVWLMRNKVIAGEPKWASRTNRKRLAISRRHLSHCYVSGKHPSLRRPQLTSDSSRDAIHRYLLQSTERRKIISCNSVMGKSCWSTRWTMLKGRRQRSLVDRHLCHICSSGGKKEVSCVPELDSLLGNSKFQSSLNSLHQRGSVHTIIKAVAHTVQDLAVLPISLSIVDTIDCIEFN